MEREDEADRIDVALISFARQHGFDITELAKEYARIYDKAFRSEDRYMVAGFAHGNGRVFFAKGDPDKILRKCTSYMTASGTLRKIDAHFQHALRAVLDSAQQAGDIVLALAYNSGTEVPPQRYLFLCLMRLRNPLKPQVPEWIRSLVAWEVRPIMLTGDRAETALTIAREAGIGPDAMHLITGKELARMPLQEVARQAAYVSVFARLLPSQKGLVVRLLQRQAHCVAMVGDGANDTVALRVADLGVSFVDLGSPLAANASRVLVRNLDDVLTLVIGAKRIARRVRCFRIFRILMLIALSLILYWWSWNLWRR